MIMKKRTSQTSFWLDRSRRTSITDCYDMRSLARLSKAFRVVFIVAIADPWVPWAQKKVGLSAVTVGLVRPFRRSKYYESWTVREHQNQKYAFDHGALVLSIPLASSYR